MKMVSLIQSRSLISLPHNVRLSLGWICCFCWCCRPLHDAVDSDCIEIVRLLLAAGADINLTTYSGKTVESLACSHDMRAFLRGCLLVVLYPCSTLDVWGLIHIPQVMRKTRCFHSQILYSWWVVYFFATLHEDSLAYDVILVAGQYISFVCFCSNVISGKERVDDITNVLPSNQDDVTCQSIFVCNVLKK